MPDQPRAEEGDLDVATVKSIIATVEALRDRYWHSKFVNDKRVRDEYATRKCLHCLGGQRALDEVLEKLRPTIRRHEAKELAAVPRPYFDTDV